MKKALTFSAAVCGFSWVVFLILYACCKGDVKSLGAGFTAFESLYMLFPMGVAMVLQKLSHEPFKSTGLLNFRFSWVWVWSVILPVVIMLLSIVTSVLMPGVRFEYGPEQLLSMQNLPQEAEAALRSQLSSLSPAMLMFSTIVSGVFAGCTINAAFAFGEEYGWRNYMVAALKGHGFWKSALLIGFVWGIWHMPLILCGHNYPQHPVAGVFMMCVFCILTGVMELYLVLRTGSVIPAAIFHGTINAVAGNCYFFINGGNDLTVGICGVAGFAAMVVVIASIWLWDRGHERILCGSVQDIS